jgi:hypothetical protein
VCCRFPSAKWPYVGSGCNWNDPGANCTASKKLTGSFQGSGTEFGMSAFVANSTMLRWAFIGNNDSQVHYEFTIHRAFPRAPPPPPAPIPPPPPPPPPPTPNPAPAPPPLGDKWECYANAMSSSLPLKDMDLTQPPFGTANATVETCEEMCNGRRDCAVVNWHGAEANGAIVNHCHLMVGKAPLRSAFAQSLKNTSGYTACIRAAS